MFRFSDIFVIIFITRDLVIIVITRDLVIGLFQLSGLPDDPDNLVECFQEIRFGLMMMMLSLASEYHQF